MTAESPHRCRDMISALEDPSVPVIYGDRFREWGLIRLGSPETQAPISHCPWCGQELPGSLRDEYFDILESMGVDADILTEASSLPEEFRTGRWWRARGL